jgi:anti-sigma B factor antagonist
VEMQERAVGPVVVIDLAGKLVAGDGDGRLKDKINSLVQQERRQILLNLSGISYIDSNGLGELVASHTTVSRHGGHIKLSGLTKRVQDLLAICRLLTVFDVYDSEEEALKSFAVTVGTT